MFERDRWQEIFEALAKNKIRTLLTAFGVFWGIFMLVIMLGSSRGLKNGIYLGMGDFATNSLFVWTQQTSMPYQGFNKGRRWNFDNDDTKLIREKVPEIKILAPRINYPQGSPTFVRDKYTATFQLNGDYPASFMVDPVNLLEGRIINDIDIDQKRKVAVIGQRVKETLFPEGASPIGKYIQVQGIYFQVVGVYKSKHNQGWGRGQNETVVIPFTTLQKAFNLGNIVFYYSMTSFPQYSISQVEPKVKEILAKKHKIHPQDMQAFGSANVEKSFSQMNNLFLGINFLTWFVGTLTLVAGVIGISNIMLVIIKERTKEIGIQRAIGATPIKIITQIVMESVFLTFIAGLIGMIVGVLIIQGINMLLLQSPSEDTMFANPEVDLQAVVTALVLLVISGVFAGMIPALKAIKIKPIEALRAEL